MRFAFAGFDRWRVVFEAFVGAGWEPMALYSIPVDNRLDFNNEIVARAEQLGIPVQLSRICEDDLRRLADRGCDALIVAGYRWKIPDWQPHLRYAANFHPSPLPDGRGPYPAMQAILEGRRDWGVSCHRIDAQFDTGEIIDAEHFPLDADEWHETLQLKLQMAAKRLAARVAGDFEQRWNGRRTQNGGSYWPRLDDAQRTLDFSTPVAEVMRVVRACGNSECIAPLHQMKVHVRRAMAWKEPHRYEPGQVVHEYHRWIVVAAADGLVALLDWSPLNASQRRQMTG
ncbi:formyl transferase [Trinickia dabaoshanensis]|uniref:Formyl transferase n=1 Tax=Trinickia dabaoshanensis TaxID=564714 RepID=A0A2N7VZL2_9BURK|nr:formyltransferase family protein [Trinickia dabaoshanensis]PMS22588.1 formyl transferase [Trinickia dabaoshanensis]